MTVGVLVLAAGSGTRLSVSGPWSKHLEPLPGLPVRLIDAVLGRVQSADDVLVATGHRAEELQAHLARCWPGTRWFTVPDVSCLPASVVAGLSLMRTDAVITVEGDVVTPKQSLTNYLRLARPKAEGLHLLVGARPARLDRCTIDIRDDGTAAAIRPVRAGETARWSVLAAACSTALRPRLRELASPLPALEGLRVSLWHTVAARLLAQGGVVQVSTASDGGVNVNTAAELFAAAAYLRASGT